MSESVRTVAVALAGALLAWCIGMFAEWELYGFWERGQFSWQGANVTRVSMLMFAVISATAYRIWRESKK